MIEQSRIQIRVLAESDKPYLSQILMDPEALRWLPMTNLLEVEEAMKVWFLFARQKSAYVVEIDGKPAGMAVLYVQNYEKLGHQCLFAIVVDRDYRGQGMGTALMRHIMREAKETFGIKLLHLEVYEGNPAYRLYERLGFVEFGRHPKFLKDSDGVYHTKVLMQKRL